MKKKSIIRKIVAKVNRAADITDGINTWSYHRVHKNKKAYKRKKYKPNDNYL